MKKTLLLTLIGLIVSVCVFGQSYLYVTTEELNLRSEPSTNSNILMTLGLNDQVEIIDANESWYKIRFGSIVGYASSKYLSPEKSSTTNEATVLICNGPSAYAYHKRYCSGLNRCTHSISNVRTSEAKALGRSPCKNCYSSSASSSSYSSPNLNIYSKPPSS